MPVFKSAGLQKGREWWCRWRPGAGEAILAVSQPRYGAVALTEKCLSMSCYLWLVNGCNCFPAPGNSAEDPRALLVFASFVFS